MKRSIALPSWTLAVIVALGTVVLVSLSHAQIAVSANDNSARKLVASHHGWIPCSLHGVLGPRTLARERAGGWSFVLALWMRSERPQRMARLSARKLVASHRDWILRGFSGIMWLHIL